MEYATKESLRLIFSETFESERKYICDVPGCGKKFVKNNFLEFHIRTHTNERPFRCEIAGCTSSYTRSWHLRRHVKISHQAKPTPALKYECAVPGCLRAYLSQDALKKHQGAVHERKNGTVLSKYQCSVCQLNFTKHNKLKAHFSQHTGEMPFKCLTEGCGKEYRIQSKLKAHEKSHAGYTCEVCENLRFPTWTSLRKHHSETHSVKRCSKCDKTFKHNALLLAHLATHSQNRPAFVCSFPDCEKSYFEKKHRPCRNCRAQYRSANVARARRRGRSSDSFQVKNLRAHQKAAHENLRFSCTECKKEFCSKQSLRRHGRKCLTKTTEGKAPKTGNERKTRTDKGVPRKKAAVFLSGVDGSPEGGLDEKLYIQDQVVESSC